MLNMANLVKVQMFATNEVYFFVLDVFPDYRHYDGIMAMIVIDQTHMNGANNVSTK